MALDDTRHPDAERLAEYADGVLAAGPRADVDAHLAACADCRAVVVETMVFMAEQAEADGRETAAASGARVIPFPSRRLVVGVASGLAAAAALVLVVRMGGMFGPRGDRPELQELVAALSTEPTRPVEGRLTGGFKYAPPPSPTRGPGDREVSPDVRIAAAKIEKLGQEQDTTEREAASGVAYLVLGDLDKGIAALEHAVAAAPANAYFQNDLSAAYLTRAVRNERPQDWPKALATAERAIALRPALVEPYFNRAVALTGLHLTQEAQQALEDYLRAGGSAEWADEVRRALSMSTPPRAMMDRDDVLLDLTAHPDAAVAARLVAQDAQFAREITEDDLLPEWAAASLAGDATRADRALAASQILADALASGVNDAITARAVAVAARSRGRSMRDLARAHVQWRLARTVYAENAPARFGPLFDEARRLFEAAGSPMALWARHYECTRLYFEGRMDDADRAAQAVRTAAEPEHSPALIGRAEWDLGSVAFQRARFGEAVAHWSRALELFEAIGERDNIATMHQSLAESFGLLGDMDESWRAHRRALALSPTVRDPRRLQSVFTGPGYTAINADLPEAAVHFFLEAYAAGRAAGDPSYLFEAEVGAGRAFANMQDPARARVQFDRALAIESQVTNLSYRTRFGADLRIALADSALRERRSDDVLRLTDEVLGRVVSVGSEYRLASLNLMRARARRQQKDFGAAQSELEQGIAHLESKRALLQQDAQRITYLDSAWDLYADMVGLTALDRSRPEEALEWADRGRARALTDLLGGERTRSGQPGGVIGADEGVLFLMVTDRGLFSWLKTRAHGTEFRHPDVAPERVAALAESFTQRGRDASRLAASLDEAYELIIRPFEASLRPITRLTIVPDWTLQRVPFAALHDARGNQYLIEQTALEMAPSFAMAAAGSRERVAAPTSIAVFVDPPSREDALAVSLPKLPWARAEARQIAGSYAGSRIFTGVDVTQRRLAAALGEFDVVHVATHAVADPQYPGGMRLALADADAPLDLSGVPAGEVKSSVVVLAACSTSRGPRSRGEVMMNLARPFLAVGVKHAVVTLWDVPDQSTAEFMNLFHHELSGGLSPADALAVAQRAEARRATAGLPWWSAFVVVSVR